MPRRASSPPLRLVRRLLLAAMLLMVGVLGGLYLLGRTARPEPERSADEREPAGAGGAEKAAPAEAAVLSEGFDYEQQVDGRPVFRLQGEQFTTDREGRVALTGVRLRLYREGEPYDVASRRATYLQETQEASLDGEVRLTGADGWTIEAERLDLAPGGRVVESGGGRARFRRGPGIHGGADRLRYEMDGERLLLSGDVRLGGKEDPDSPRAALTAASVTWQRSDATVVAEGDVRLVWGRSEVEGSRVEARLLADESGFESAAAIGAVRGTIAADEERRVRLESARAEVAFDPATGDPSSVALSSSGGEPARLHLRARGEGVRRLSAPEIRLALAAGAPSEAEAWGGVEIEETLPRRPRRTYRGERGRARFGAGGALAEASLDGAVELQDGKLTATGDRATLERDGELATLLGKPAVGKSERGELSAPKLVYESGPGRLRAEEGARARFHAREGGLPAPADADPREPIHVEAARGAFTLEPKTFEFEGAVQAVQGETLLFADKLTGDQAAGKSTASGHVRTIWQDRPETGPKPPPTTVQAETLDYLREAGELHYRGGVRIRQGAREIRAAECVVELDGEQRAERVRAGGEVRIDDRESGRTVEGEVADYDLAQRAAIVTGDPVTIREKGGTVLQGRRARFDLESGVARLLSELP